MTLVGGVNEQGSRLVVQKTRRCSRPFVATVSAALSLIICICGCRCSEIDQAVDSSEPRDDAADEVPPLQSIVPEPEATAMEEPKVRAPSANRPREVGVMRLNASGAWARLVGTTAVDSDERLYVTDGSTIYGVTPEGATPYLTTLQIAKALSAPVLKLPRWGDNPAQMMHSVRIESIDQVGGRLYILNSGPLNAILMSDAPGRVEPYVGLGGSMSGPRAISAIGPGRVCLSTSNALWLVGPAQQRVVADSRAAGSLGGCVNEGMAAHDDGFLFYLPGCRDTGLSGGTIETGSFRTLMKQEDVGLGPGSMPLALARHPNGAVVCLATGLVVATRDGELTKYPFPTSLADQLKRSFGKKGLAVGPSGSIYLVADFGIQKMTLSGGPVTGTKI